MKTINGTTTQTAMASKVRDLTREITMRKLAEYIVSQLGADEVFVLVTANGVVGNVSAGDRSALLREVLDQSDGLERA